MFTRHTLVFALALSPFFFANAHAARNLSPLISRSEKVATVRGIGPMIMRPEVVLNPNGSDALVRFESVTAVRDENPRVREVRVKGLSVKNGRIFFEDVDCGILKNADRSGWRFGDCGFTSTAGFLHETLRVFAYRFRPEDGNFLREIDNEKTFFWRERIALDSNGNPFVELKYILRGSVSDENEDKEEAIRLPELVRNGDTVTYRGLTCGRIVNHGNGPTLDRFSEPEYSENCAFQSLERSDSGDSHKLYLMKHEIF